MFLKVYLEKQPRGWSIFSFLNAVQTHSVREGNLVTNNFNNVLKNIIISTTYNEEPTLRLKKKPIFYIIISVWLQTKEECMQIPNSNLVKLL